MAAMKWSTVVGGGWTTQKSKCNQLKPNLIDFRSGFGAHPWRTILKLQYELIPENSYRSHFITNNWDLERMGVVKGLVERFGGRMRPPSFHYSPKYPTK